jgi:hypothetical protein
MLKNELRAKVLAAGLRVRGIDARVKGRGVHWQVAVRSAGGRSARVYCYWYERAISALMVGMNPANSRSRLRAPVTPYEGPEYQVVVDETGARVVEGRTRSMKEAIRCVRGWLRGASLDELAVKTPFLDQQYRELSTIGAGLDPRLQWEILDPEIWV